MTTATITWSDPTARVDGSALTLTALQVFDDLGDGKGPQLLGNVSPGVQTFNTPTLTPGSHTFTVVAQDNSNPPENSAPSTPVSVTVPTPVLAAPAAPTNVKVVLNN